jgi:hypothetical protein
MPLSDSLRRILSHAPITANFVDSEDEIRQRDHLESVRKLKQDELARAQTPARFLLPGGESPEHTEKILLSEFSKDVPGETIEQRFERTRNSIGDRTAAIKEDQDKWGDATIPELKSLAEANYKNTGANAKGEKDKFARSTTLRKEFNSRPEVRDWVAVSTNIDAMESSLQNVLSGNVKNLSALDQGLITMYNKLTDPTSVVRESEFARTPENVPIVNRVMGAIHKIKSGGAGMENADREALVIGAKIIANERGKTFQDTKEQYSVIAGHYGIDPNLVTSVYDDFNTPYDTVSKLPATALDKMVGGAVETLDTFLADPKIPTELRTKANQLKGLKIPEADIISALKKDLGGQ